MTRWKSDERSEIVRGGHERDAAGWDGWDEIGRRSESGDVGDVRCYFICRNDFFWRRFSRVGNTDQIRAWMSGRRWRRRKAKRSQSFCKRTIRKSFRSTFETAVGVVEASAMKSLALLGSFLFFVDG